jgi:hypothetical protein
MRNEIYISVDVEADGPIPGLYSMNSLGAAVSVIRYKDGTVEKLDPETPIGAELPQTFYTQLKPTAVDWVDEAFAVGLVEGVDPEASLEDKRAYLIENGEDAEEAMTRFAEWLNAIAEHYQGAVVFAAYPLGYDWMWTYWYLMAFSKHGSPFGHSRHIDAKTAYAITDNKLVRDSVKSRMPRHLMSKRKHTHKAIDDAIEQGEMLYNILTMKA